LHEDENKDTKERKEKLSSGRENDQWTSSCTVRDSGALEPMPTLRRGRYNTVQGKANAGMAGYILIWQKCLSQVLGDHNVFEWSKREIGSSHDQGEERLSLARLGRLPLGGLVINYLLAVPKYYVFSFSRDRGALSKSLASASAATRGAGARHRQALSLPGSLPTSSCCTVRR
jgi:hypothetical protein